MENEENSIITKKVLALLEESFVHVYGYYLSKDTSFFSTLNRIDYLKASEIFPNAKETIAGHINHVILSLQYTQDYLNAKDTSQYEWDKNWNMNVDASQWKELNMKLNNEYEQVRTFVRNIENWMDGAYLDVMIGAIAHCAYHLAIIRQHIDS